MLYYRITADADQRPRRDGSILVENELYTPEEIERYRIKPQFYEAVDVSESKTFWLFGARFAEEGE